MTTTELARAIREASEPLSGADDPDLDPLLERIGSSRVVLLGEATHGTSEFYRLRTAATRALVERAGFNIVAVEADWPDAARVDRHIRGVPVGQTVTRPFSRFPTWMWSNQEVAGLVSWMRHWNEGRAPEDQAGFHGLDLYSMHGSVEAVLAYLDDVDPEAAALARARYGCLSAWQDDPAAYGHAAVTGRLEGCAGEVAAMLGDLLQRRLELEERGQDGVRTFDAIQNARLVSHAEQYYRVMYQGSTASWNLRDRHMFETLEALLDFRGEGSRAVVWAHNSHLGNAAATEMGQRGQINIGSQARERFGDDAYLIGFGTDRGTVAAAHDWGAPMQVMEVRPARDDSYEGLMRETGSGAFLLPLRPNGGAAVRDQLMDPRLERAIGVIYRPRTERQSHYFDAVLPRQFDEYVWIAETEAVTPIRQTPADRAEAETFPFGL